MSNPDRPLKRSQLPLGTRVRFRPDVAPKASERYGQRVATVVRRNVSDGEVGIVFGYAEERRPGVWSWPGNSNVVWAEPRELEVVE